MAGVDAGRTGADAGLPADRQLDCPGHGAKSVWISELVDEVPFGDSRPEGCRRGVTARDEGSAFRGASGKLEEAAIPISSLLLGDAMTAGMAATTGHLRIHCEVR